MTSTGFTVGLDGTRVSSKVLKPPGGGSSDIFGFGSSQNSSANGATNERLNSTQNRLFGGQSAVNATPVTPRVKSNIFGNEDPAPRSVQKPYVRRNPITGEEIKMYPENTKTKNGDKKDSDNEDDVTDNTQQDGDDKVPEMPSKPVQTSIRIRNPPGGKSSGIF